MCPFDFKTLRVIRVLSAQIVAAVTTAYVDMHNVFALVTLPLSTAFLILLLPDKLFLGPQIC